MISITCNLCGSTSKIRFHEDHGKELCKECHDKIHRDKNKSKGSRKERYIEYINSSEWKLKREEAFKYYGKKCSQCGSEKLLHVHHNTYKNFRHEEMKDLNVLCEVCHMALHDRINKRKMNKLGKNVVKKEPNKNNKSKKKKTKNKPVKTMAEIVLTLEQQQKNAEIRRLHKDKKESRGQIHIGIGTPSQRQYKETNPLPVEVVKKPKTHKPKKTKKSKITNEYVKVKTWLDVIQDEFDMKKKA